MSFFGFLLLLFPSLSHIPPNWKLPFYLNGLDPGTPGDLFLGSISSLNSMMSVATSTNPCLSVWSTHFNTACHQNVKFSIVYVIPFSMKNYRWQNIFLNLLRYSHNTYILLKSYFLILFAYHLDTMKLQQLVNTFFLRRINLP